MREKSVDKSESRGTFVDFLGSAAGEACEQDMPERDTYNFEGEN